MIIIMKESASAKEIESVEKLLAEFGFQTHPIQGEKKTVIGAIGDKRLLSMNQILTMDGVENVVPIMKPYKLASKELHKEPSVIEIGHGITVGGKQLAVFAGPCAIESQGLQILQAACSICRPLRNRKPGTVHNCIKGC